jgi:hypothetical protein
MAIRRLAGKTQTKSAMSPKAEKRRERRGKRPMPPKINDSRTRIRKPNEIRRGMVQVFMVWSYFACEEWEGESA